MVKYFALKMILLRLRVDRKHHRRFSLGESSERDRYSNPFRYQLDSIYLYRTRTFAERTATFVFFCILGVVRLDAQEKGFASDQNNAWFDAVKLLDHPLMEEAKRGETFLRQELGRSETPVEAAWALALFCIKRNDWTAADKVLKAIDTGYPNPPMSVLAAIERVKLSVALYQEDATTAEVAFKKLAHATSNTKLAKEDRQLNAASIGSIVGMLEVDSSRSPIPLAMLNQVREILTDIKKDDINPQFQFGYQSSQSKADLLAEKLVLLETQGIDTIQSELQRMKLDRESQSQLVEDAEEALRLAKLNTEEQMKANRVSIKQIQTNVAKLERNWKAPTPGHPGPEKPAPVKPKLTSIVVDEFEYRNETVIETDSTGKQIRRTRSVPVRRPQAEIDRERDFQYARLMDIYRIYKSEFDETIAKYRNVLAVWTKADQDRREKLQEEKREGLQKASELDKQIDALEAERTASVKMLTEMRKKLKEFENEEEALTEVIRTAAMQTPERSFRPGFFETIFIQKEKSRLFKAFQGSNR